MTEFSFRRLVAPALVGSAFAALLLAPPTVIPAEAGYRSNSSGFSSYVPRSSFNGSSPGTFGRSDRTQGRIEADQLQIQRFQENSRIRAREREILRQQRDVTGNRPAAPSNRLTDRLRPQVEPLGNLRRGATNQADRQIIQRTPTNDFSDDTRSLGQPSLFDSRGGFHYLDRNTR